VQDIAIVEESIELLPLISRRLFATVADLPESHGLTVAQSRAIVLLYHAGDLTMGELASGLGISLPSASELIDRLEAQGMVERNQDPLDRRRIFVTLTDDSLRFGVQIHDLHRAQVRQAIGMLDPAERPVFLKSLQALASALGPAERSGS
jgi:MarR family transcriptional regulator, organic hydroperoxide resistance regulator